MEANLINNIEEKLFHGINLEYYKDKISELKIYSQILKSEKIKTREELLEEKYLYYDKLPRIYEQATDEVCVAIHPKNETFRYVYDFDIDYGTAFYHYIRTHISFVLSEDLLNSVDYTLQYGDAGEIRIKSGINLRKYLIAIGIYNFADSIAKCDLISNNYYLYRLFLEDKKRYLFVNRLLNEYGYNIPIINSINGKVIENNYDIKILKYCDRVIRNKSL